ncbi:MAG: ribonuclease P protein component [Saprospiraceae bacterium]
MTLSLSAMGRKYRFPAKFRLKSRKSIEAVFASNESVLCHPLLCRYRIITDEGAQPEAAFAVPKKNFRKSVERNRIKRLMREAFRLNRQEFLQPDADSNAPLQMVFVYLDRKISSYKIIHQQMARILTSLRQKVS